MASTNQVDWSPNDWPESLQEMRTIDNLLRCSICYEFFHTAVLFQECSHNYCSICIRQAMVYDPQCPTCFEKTSSNDLKCNRVLDELVKNFINVRSKLLDLINKALMQNVPEKKEKQINEQSDDSASNFEITLMRKKLPRKTKTKKGKSPCITPRNKRKRRKLESSDSDDVDGEEDVRGPQAMEVDTLKSPGNKSKTSQPTENPNSYVECPVCGELTNNAQINSHLDRCLITGKKKNSLRSHNKASDTTRPKSEQVSTANASTSSTVASSFMKSPLRLATSSSSSSSPSHSKSTNKVTGSNAFVSAGPKRKAIPGTVYAILSDKQLKQKLKEWNLSTQGDRKTLIKRHQEFVVAYNAQCDSVKPKSASAIVKELEIREKRRNARLLNSTSTGPNLNLNKDASEEEVDKVHKEYLQQNKGHFEKLINEIRSRKKPSTTSSDDKPTKSLVIIDDGDSKQDAKTESSTVHPEPHPHDEVQHKKDDDRNVGSSETNKSELSSPKKTISKKLSILCKSSTSGTHPRQIETQDGGNQESDPSQETSRHVEECSELAVTNTKSNTENEKQVPEPPLISNLASINESMSSNDDSDKDDTDDDDNGDDNGDDDDEDDDDEDDTNGNEEEDKNDKDWEMTPSFGIASSGEEFNYEDENGQSDEDLFASLPRPKTKMRSLRRRKK